MCLFLAQLPSFNSDVISAGGSSAGTPLPEYVGYIIGGVVFLLLMIFPLQRWLQGRTLRLARRAATKPFRSRYRDGTR